MSAADGESNYGNIIADCAVAGLGVFAIRVFAGGALLGQPASAHTLRTPFFPLALFERDSRRARELSQRLGGRFSLAELAIRFALSHPGVSSAIIGFGSPEHVNEIATFDLEQPLPRNQVTGPTADSRE
jgi:aryl-alcohol dehydrogenase-like predicted oxidoreductase